MISGCQDLDRILVVIPIRNEEETIVGIIRSLQAHGLTRIRVVDNGSLDHSAEHAKDAGAEVVFEPEPGYGRACWRGLQQVPTAIDWILFCDGDGSDDLSQLPQFLAARTDVDLVLGDRRATAAGRAALTPVQNLGNRLATTLIGVGWGYWYHDLGPLRLIRRSALDRMQMRDRGFGWTVEMQVRAVELGLRICELPVNYHPRRGGTSKISGTLSGSIQAGSVILGTIAQLHGRRWATWVKSESPLLWLSSLLILLGCGWLMPNGDFRQLDAMPQFCIGASILGIGFVLSWGVRAISPLWFWGVAIAARLLLLPMAPGDDIWRYLWEGYIQTQGFSPYHFAPNAAELMPYRTAWWSQIAFPDISAIYPPLAQLGFRGLAATAPSVLLFKFAFVGADLLSCWLLSRRFGYRATLLYTWNPLVLYAFAGGAHYDSWFILPLVAAWLLFDTTENQNDWRRWAGSALWVGISVAIKWMSLPLVAFLFWRALVRADVGDRLLALLVALCGGLPLLLSALTFCQSGSCPLVPTGSFFVANGRSAEFVPHLVSLIWASTQQTNWIYLIPLGISILWLLRHARSLLQFSEWYVFALLVLSPIVHAWYFTWLIPFAVASRNLGTRLISLSAFIYFVLPHRLALGNSDWRLTATERWLLWLPLLLGWLWTARRSLMRTK
jgi:hypothetical protein